MSYHSSPSGLKVRIYETFSSCFVSLSSMAVRFILHAEPEEPDALHRKAYLTVSRGRFRRPA